MDFKVFGDTEYFRGERFVIGTSVLKDLSADNFCPLKLYHKYMMDMQTPPTESMKYGSFFETLILGAGAKGKKITELERNKDGTMKAVEKRIRWIAEHLWPQVKKEYDIVVDKVQAPVSMILNEHFILETHIDILGRINGRGAIIDIKMCGDVNTTYGDYCWGEPHLMDHSQPNMCVMLVEHMYKETAPFFYIVFDHKPESDYKVINRNVTEVDRHELLRKINLASERYIQMHADKWPANPSFEQCKKCPVKDCTKRIQRKEIIFI